MMESGQGMGVVFRWGFGGISGPVPPFGGEESSPVTDGLQSNSFRLFIGFLYTRRVAVEDCWRRMSSASIVTKLVLAQAAFGLEQPRRLAQPRAVDRVADMRPFMA